MMVKKNIEQSERRIVLTVNGHRSTVNITPGMMLVDVLRDQLGLTGVKIGCRRGECGACTVQIDGKPVLSCLFPAIRSEGKKIITVEGLKTNGQLHALQEAFIDHGAIQCGFCTPGMLIAAKALLDENHNPSLSDIREALSGNLCRCGGYQNIFKAVLSTKRKHRLGLIG
jgi:carbon-monoxide dehydrogenase small subunit